MSRILAASAHRRKRFLRRQAREYLEAQGWPDGPICPHCKHLAAYLEEMSFRFNRRERSDLFVETLRRMVTASVLTCEKLMA